MAQPNMLPATIAELARRRVDMVGSTFVTDAEVLGYVQAAWEEFYALVVSKHEDFFVKKATTPLGANPGTVTYNLATDFLKLRGIRIRNKEFLRRLDLREAPLLDFDARRGRPTHYSTEGGLSSSEPTQQVTFYPTCDTSYTLDYWYIPYLALEDVFPTSLYKVALWREYLVVCAGIKMRDKEESDCSVLLTEKAQLFEVIEKSMSPLDTSEPFSIIQHGGMRPGIYDDPEYPELL